MVEDFQPGETETDDFTMADEDFEPPDFDYDDYDDDDEEEEDLDVNVDPEPESFDLLEEMDGIPEDEKGLGDEMANYLSNV